MKVLALKTCDTCRKALTALRAAGHAPEVVDVRGDGIAPADLAEIVAAFGAQAVNRSSTTWRGLSEEERALPVEALIAAHPTLLKRPAIRDDAGWTLGWDGAVQRRHGL